MRRTTIVLLAASAIPAMGQEPSPPPWFGGRVEMPAQGVAITFPDDWIAFDLTAGTDTQVDIANQVRGDSSRSCLTSPRRGYVRTPQRTAKPCWSLVRSRAVWSARSLTSRW